MYGSAPYGPSYYGSGQDDEAFGGKYFTFYQNDCKGSDAPVSRPLIMFRDDTSFSIRYGPKHNAGASSDVKNGDGIMPKRLFVFYRNDQTIVEIPRTGRMFIYR